MDYDAAVSEDGASLVGENHTWYYVVIKFQKWSDWWELRKKLAGEISEVRQGLENHEESWRKLRYARSGATAAATGLLCIPDLEQHRCLPQQDCSRVVSFGRFQIDVEQHRAATGLLCTGQFVRNRKSTHSRPGATTLPYSLDYTWYILVYIMLDNSSVRFDNNPDFFEVTPLAATGRCTVGSIRFVMYYDDFCFFFLRCLHPEALGIIAFIYNNTSHWLHSTEDVLQTWYILMTLMYILLSGAWVPATYAIIKIHIL